MDIYLNTNHDIDLLSRDLRMTTSDEDLRQRLSINLQFLFEEWFIDTTVGIPYTQVIFESNYNDINSLQDAFRSFIKDIEGVVAIDQLDLDLNKDGRELTITLKVNGNTELEVTI